MLAVPTFLQRLLEIIVPRFLACVSVCCLFNVSVLKREACPDEVMRLMRHFRGSFMCSFSNNSLDVNFYFLVIAHWACSCMTHVHKCNLDDENQKCSPWYLYKPCVSINDENNSTIFLFNKHNIVRPQLSCWTIGKLYFNGFNCICQDSCKHNFVLRS